MRAFTTITPDEAADIDSCARKRGYEYGDFTTFERSNPSDVPFGFYVFEGTLKVTYRPNNKTRTYRTGNGSFWPAEFDADLAAGYFGPPRGAN